MVAFSLLVLPDGRRSGTRVRLDIGRCVTVTASLLIVRGVVRIQAWISAGRRREHARPARRSRGAARHIPRHRVAGRGAVRTARPVRLRNLRMGRHRDVRVVLPLGVSSSSFSATAHSKSRFCSSRGPDSGRLSRWASLQLVMRFGIRKPLVDSASAALGLLLFARAPVAGGCSSSTCSDVDFAQGPMTTPSCSRR